MAAGALAVPGVHAIAKSLSDTMSAGQIAWARYFFQFAYLLLPPVQIRVKMTAIFDGQKEGAGLAPGCLRMLWLSERLIVVGMGWIDTVAAMLLSIQINELQLIVRADAVAQVIEELDNGLSLLRRPVGRDGERDCHGQARRGWFCHGLPPRR
jgi:hypothetical protein